VVFEKLPDQPPKPPNILIEKWLPYKPRSRRVIYERSCVPPPPNPRNLVIEWEQPDVEVEQQCVNLGVVNADPDEYIRQFGCELKQPCEMPDLCHTRPPPAPVCPPPEPVCVANACCETSCVVAPACPVAWPLAQTVTAYAEPSPVRRLFRSSSVNASFNVQLTGDVHALRYVI
jgi:hypothetical protein